MGLLDQVHSFAQGASNGVAGSLTGPVDGLAWLLRKAGVPMPDAPMGGSDWMRNVGLMQEPKERMAGLLGEGIGSALPTVIAGKAPQIANGLLQMEANAMAPRTLSPQTGAIVWHGSPHKFDKFDSSKIGTGEGAQAYGHGLYLAESPDVAGSYAQSVKANTGELIKRGAAHGLPEDVASNLASALQSGKNFDPLLDSARKMIDNPLVPAPQRQAAQRLLDNEMPAYNAWSEWSKPGQVYKVDLPDDQIARMLDWDKPLSQQAPEVQKALAATKNKQLRAVVDYASSPYSTPGLEGEVKTMGEAIKLLGMNSSPAKGSAMLAKQGIPGIRYLDGGSRGAGAGTSNYVVFPGNEGLLKILERNGQGLLGN